MEAEVVSWFRIQEMFRFDAIHMYGIIGTAVATAALSLLVIRRLGLRAADGTPLGLAPKQLGSGRRYAIGGAAIRSRLGPDRIVPGTDGRVGGSGSSGDDRGDCQRARGHVDLRLAPASAAALTGSEKQR